MLPGKGVHRLSSAEVGAKFGVEQLLIIIQPTCRKCNFMLLTQGLEVILSQTGLSPNPNSALMLY